MRKYLLLLFVPFLWNCSSDDDNSATVVLPAQTLNNVSYGTDSEQIMDIYLPEGRNEFSTKVLIMVHGGSWYEGSKDDLTAAVALARIQFPAYAIVNIDYRLATFESPAYPKQINDLQSVIDHLETHGYAISKQYAFVGVSAGAHLSMLYAYHFDTQHKVKAVCSIVGPTDFTDPAYQGSEFTPFFQYLAGMNPTAENIAEVSPITHVTADAPPTIQFNGNADTLVPISQGERMKAALDAAGVANQRYVYDAGHGTFSVEQSQDINAKMNAFLLAYF